MKFHIAILMVLLSWTASEAQIKIGDSIPSILLQSSSNERININQFENKYILIDFWASWCGPCRLGNKELVKLHNSVNPDDLQIIGISLDTDPSKWLKAIEKDKVKFVQLIDPKGFDAPTAIQFGVDELPSQYLFDKEGTLIKINPTKDEIIQISKK